MQDRFIFFGRNYVDVVENLNDKNISANTTVFADVDTRSKRHRKITFRDVAAFYGQRPSDDARVWYLSPYEFVTEWEVIMLKYPQSLHDAHNDKYHAELTAEGVELLTLSRSRTPKLEAGIHYRVKEGQHRTWISYPSGFATDSFRHTWVISKRPRPVAPMFIGTPIPLRTDDSADRSAMLTMAYFHPWTLRKDDAEASYVPFAGGLRAEGVAWQEALATWLNGEVISEESMRYINNVLSVYRVRPRDPTEDILSDDDFSDEELELTEVDLARALRSKVGGREPRANGKAKSSTSGKTSHEENSRTGMAMAQQIWSVTEKVDVAESCNCPVDPMHVKASLKSARASQRQDKVGSTLPLSQHADPSLQIYASCTIKNVTDWLKDVKKRKSECDRMLLNKEQYAVVKRVADRIIEEMRAVRNNNFSSIGEPLRWSMHGGPGTGKTHVIKLLKE